MSGYLRKERCNRCDSVRVRFTLIELLVVIAIIAVLASLLLPALQNARKTAKGIICLNNMKEMGILLQLYTQDYNGHVTPLRRVWDNNKKTWPAYLWNELGNNAPMPIEGPVADERAWKAAVKRAGLFVCPSDGGKRDDSGLDVDPNLSYAFNRYAHTPRGSDIHPLQYSSGDPLYRLSRISRPSGLIYVTDAAQNSPSGSVQRGYLYTWTAGSIIHPYDQAVYWTGTWFTPWHSGRTWNYLYIDGHGEKKQPGDTTGDGNTYSDQAKGDWTAKGTFNNN